jgi:glycosyltransferase involved in cell wall biosynthesis
MPGERGRVIRKDPVLSVIIPAFNVAPYIADAVTSALDQSYADLEVIVVDDGSTDATPQVLEAVASARADPRLRVITRINGGLSAARNTGIAAARGEFIGFLDGDDVWCPTKAERHVEHLLKDDKIGISFSYAEYLTHDGKRTHKIWSTDNLNPTALEMILSNHVGNGSAPVVRRLCFEKAGVFREDLRSCEDYEMWCRILWCTQLRAAAIPEALVLYRLRGDSLSFAFENFLANGDKALSALRAMMCDVPERIFRSARAEQYRVAAWKAELTGQHRAAVKMAAQSLRLHPRQVLEDLREGASTLALFLPPRWRMRVTGWYRSLRDRWHPSSGQADETVGSGLTVTH